MSQKIETEQIVKIQDLQEISTCAYGHTFLSNQVLLVPFIFRGNDLGEVISVDKTFEVFKGIDSSQVGKPTEGYLLACPVCKLVHLYGFKSGKDSTEVLVGKDNSRVRNLTLDF